jgi:hypothetical protein
MNRALSETGKFRDRRMRDEKASQICTVFDFLISFLFAKVGEVLDYFDVYSLETSYVECPTAFCRSLICNRGGGVFIVR